MAEAASREEKEVRVAGNTRPRAAILTHADSPGKPFAVLKPSSGGGTRLPVFQQLCRVLTAAKWDEPEAATMFPQPCLGTVRSPGDAGLREEARSIA